MKSADFVATICASPEDDAVRLIYADWLEENGDAARAEFIRLQLRLEGFHRHDSARRKPEERATVLLNEHREIWLRELPAWARKHAEFRRGFVHHIEPTSEAFLRGARELFRQAPVRSVAFRDAQTRERSLISSSLSGSLKTFNGLLPMMTLAVPLDELVDSSALTHVHALDLSGYRVGPHGAVALASSRHLANLRALYLDCTDLGSEGVAALAASPHFTNLRILDLSSSGTTQAGIDALANSHTLKLQALALWDTPLPWDGIDEAVRRLMQSSVCSNLVELDLIGNNITCATAQHLASAPAQATLRDLNLTGGMIQADGARALATLPNLHRLILRYNPIGDAGVVALAESPNLRELIELDLSGGAEVNVEIGDIGALALLQCQHLVNLRYLALDGSFSPAVQARLKERFWTR